MANYLCKKVSLYALPISQGTSVTDRRTDRQTDDNHANSSSRPLLKITKQLSNSLRWQQAKDTHLQV